MAIAPQLLPETPADPLDLEAFRRNGHALVDWIVRYLADLSRHPVGAAVAPGEVRAELPAAAPEAPEPFSAVLADLDRVIRPGLAHWQHPGWFAWFPAMSSPASVLGELAAAGLGVQGMMWATSPALTELESHVLDWLVDLMGLPQRWKTTSAGGGVLTSGASTSTLVALIAARDHCRRRTGADVEQMTVYASGQAHSSVEKGARLAGFTRVRSLAVDQHFAATPEALTEAIKRDRLLGLVPAVVVSALGTTGTTAVDPIGEFGRVADANHLWHHVDAAYAGSAMICEEFRVHLDGIDRAHSYTFNPHKWLATNLDCSVLWVADRTPLNRAMGIEPPYLHNDASRSGHVIDYRNWDISLGRPFRALKLWFVLRAFGAEGLRGLIRRHTQWATELSERIDRHPRLHRIAPTPFALVSFAHTAGSAATLALAQAVNSSGRFLVTVSEIDGRPYLRVAIGATWTTRHDLDRLWACIQEHLATEPPTPREENPWEQ
ncbi:pyridoxal phosphate-dependent decarboxylase family protein [Candidatus Poriferisocius sp.]|uniref:pyridoxal phosphate-dependent decarboxylase family protein n=1 Tax=Candidatus Poriferisocius sp. TaxID=3101276 RepID=UPI003B5BD4CD